MTVIKKYDSLTVFIRKRPGEWKQRAFVLFGLFWDFWHISGQKPLK